MKLDKQTIEILIISIALAILLGCKTSMTGMTVTDFTQDQEESIGTYLVNPSVHAEVPYSLEDYTVLKQVVFEKLLPQVQACRIAGEENCFEEGIQNINNNRQVLDTQLSFFNGPCDEQENVESDFVEQYTACLESSEAECVCDINLALGYNHQEQDAQVVVSGNPEESLSGDDIFLTVKRTLSQIPARTAKNVDSAPDLGGASQFVLQQGRHAFYKRDNILYSITDNSGESLLQCTINKNVFKICVRKQANFVVWDETQRKSGNKPVEYKFALLLEETLVEEGEKANSESLLLPQVKGVYAELQENEVQVFWSFPESEDVHHFAVYAEYSDFIDVEGLLPKAEISLDACDADTCTTKLPSGPEFIAVTAVNDRGDMNVLVRATRVEKNS
jgi:hypothetical protein